MINVQNFSSETKKMLVLCSICPFTVLYQTMNEHYIKDYNIPQNIATREVENFHGFDF